MVTMYNNQIFADIIVGVGIPRSCYRWPTGRPNSGLNKLNNLVNKIAFTQSLFPLLSFFVSFHLLPFHFFCKLKLHPVAWHREKDRALQKEESAQKFFGKTTKRTRREKRQWRENKLKLRRGLSIWAKKLSKLFYKEMTEPSL